MQQMKVIISTIFILPQLKWPGTLLLAFRPKILEGGGVLQLLFCAKRNAASVVLIKCGHPETLLDGKKIMFMHSQAVGMQKHSNFPKLLSTNADTPYEPPGETFTT